MLQHFLSCNLNGQVIDVPAPNLHHQIFLIMLAIMNMLVVKLPTFLATNTTAESPSCCGKSLDFQVSSCHGGYSTPKFCTRALRLSNAGRLSSTKLDHATRPNSRSTHNISERRKRISRNNMHQATRLLQISSSFSLLPPSK